MRVARSAIAPGIAPRVDALRASPTRSLAILRRVVVAVDNAAAVGETSGEVDPLDRAAPHVAVLVHALDPERAGVLGKLVQQGVQVRIGR